MKMLSDNSKREEHRQLSLRLYPFIMGGVRQLEAVGGVIEMRPVM